MGDNSLLGMFGGGPQGLMDFGDQPPSLPFQIRDGHLAGQGWELGCDQFLWHWERRLTVGKQTGALALCVRKDG